MVLLKFSFSEETENYLTMPVCTRNIPLGDGNVLRNLHSVYMSDNSFTGAIRASIFTQPALEYLDLNSNCLSSHIGIPEYICDVAVYFLV